MYGAHSYFIRFTPWIKHLTLHQKEKNGFKVFHFQIEIGSTSSSLINKVNMSNYPNLHALWDFCKKKSTLSLQLLRKFKKMSNVWDWWKLPSYNCQRFDFKGIISKPWLGYLKGIIRYFGSKIWKMRIKTNAKWQQFCRIWFLGGWIDPCQMFDFRENCLKTLTLWLGHLKGLVR